MNFKVYSGVGSNPMIPVWCEWANVSIHEAGRMPLRWPQWNFKKVCKRTDDKTNVEGSTFHIQPKYDIFYEMLIFKSIHTYFGRRNCLLVDNFYRNHRSTLQDIVNK